MSDKTKAELVRENTRQRLEILKLRSEIRRLKRPTTWDWIRAIWATINQFEV